MLNIARDWSAVVRQAAAPVAEITVLVFGFFFFYLGVSCQLLAGQWGRGQSMFL